MSATATKKQAGLKENKEDKQEKLENIGEIIGSLKEEEKTKTTKEALAGFVFTEEVIKALDLAFMCEENIILWGKGGHGEITIL